MNKLTLTAVCACCTLLAPTVLAGPEHDHNSKAPITQDMPNPTKAGGAMCPAGSMSGDDTDDTMDTKSTTTTGERVGDPYPFTTCPISGEELASDMGDPIVKFYNGREVKFCCKKCVPKFEKDLNASLAALDQKIIESQLPYYPLTTCIISGESFDGLDEDGEPMGEPINFVYNNRLIRFCCKMCKGDFKKDPEAYIAKLDAAVIAQQSEHYPLTTCPISGEDLSGDEMGEPIKKVYNGRLVEFCCKKCVAKFEANPAPTLEKLDAAWMAMHSDAHEVETEANETHEGHEMNHGHGHSEHDDG